MEWKTKKLKIGEEVPRRRQIAIVSETKLNTNIGTKTYVSLRAYIKVRHNGQYESLQSVYTEFFIDNPNDKYEIPLNWKLQEDFL